MADNAKIDVADVGCVELVWGESAPTKGWALGPNGAVFHKGRQVGVDGALFQGKRPHISFVRI